MKATNLGWATSTVSQAHVGSSGFAVVSGKRKEGNTFFFQVMKKAGSFCQLVSKNLERT